VLHPSFFRFFNFFFLSKMYDSRTFRPWGQTLGMWYLFGKPKESSPMNEEGKWNSTIAFVFLLRILTLMYFFGPFRDLCFITGRKLYVRTLFTNI